MKKFTAYAPDMENREKEKLIQAGFDILADPAEVPATEGDIELLWRTRASADAGALLAEVARMRPRLIILQVNQGFLSPAHWGDIFTVRECCDRSSRYLFGSKYEAPLPDDMEALLLEGNTTALAEVLYNYLLREVFRETADWCGHMSSVVGRM